MINRIHSRLGTAGFILAIIALVAVLTGAAFAAGGLTKQQEKQVKKIAKKYAGKRGPAGPQGLPGAKGDQGAKGDTGAAGTPGQNGQDGQDGQNGEDGACSVGTPDCVLPSKATMTGDWAFSTPSGGAEEWVFTSISFPLQAVPAPEYGPPGENVVWVPVGGDKEHCPGTAADPQADPGFLCLYGAELINVQGFPTLGSLLGNLTADTNSGLTLAFVLQDSSVEAYGFGSWAYTAA